MEFIWIIALVLACGGGYMFITDNPFKRTQFDSGMRKQVVDMLINDLNERPTDFDCDKYHLKDNKTGREWWIANEGYAFALVKPFKVEIGITSEMRHVEGDRAYAAYLKWRDAGVMERIKFKEEEYISGNRPPVGVSNSAREASNIKKGKK